jgi:hypothetical protein
MTIFRNRSGKFTCLIKSLLLTCQRPQVLKSILDAYLKPDSSRQSSQTGESPTAATNLISGYEIPKKHAEDAALESALPSSSDHKDESALTSSETLSYAEPDISQDSTPLNGERTDGKGDISKALISEMNSMGVTEPTTSSDPVSSMEYTASA